MAANEDYDQFDTTISDTPPALKPWWGEGTSTWLALASGRRSDWSVDLLENYSGLIEIGNGTNNNSTFYSKVASMTRDLDASEEAPGVFQFTGATGSPDRPFVATVAIMGFATISADLWLPTVLSEPSVWITKGPPVFVPGSVRYYAQVIPATGAPVQISISSWQGTIQADRADFLQVVSPFPSETDFSAVLAAVEAGGAELVVYQSGDLAGGSVSLKEVIRVTLEAWYRNEGPRRVSLTLSGYRRLATYPVPASRHSVKNCSTVMASSAGISARCDLDWYLVPGMTAILPDNQEIPVSYINYYVSSREAWMQVGERN